jgi:hypothetical protein
LIVDPAVLINFLEDVIDGGHSDCSHLDHSLVRFVND